jgi:periplasmic copper chaperone A
LLRLFEAPYRSRIRRKSMFPRSFLRAGGAAAAFFCLIAFHQTLQAKPGDANPRSGGQLSVTDAWIRGMPLSGPSGGYFTLTNRTGKEMVLTGAASPACGMLMLHRSENMGGRIEMKMVSEVPVPAGGSVAFAPGGYHLMCMQAKPAIKPGGSVPVSLIFKDGTRLTSQFPVRDAAGK